MFRTYWLAALLLIIIANPLSAQQPTKEQRDAIRSFCRSDFIAYCSSVQPGGKEALECLSRSDAKLTPACKTALSAVAPARPVAPVAGQPADTESPQAAPESPPSEQPRAAQAEPKEDQINAIRQACTLNDFIAHCSWIQPSSPEILLCLQANAANLSPACQAALRSLPSAPTPAAAGTQPAESEPIAPAVPAKKPQTTTPANVTSPSAPAANQAFKPGTEQLSAVRAACRSDFMSRCQGVKPGGPKALQCLQRDTEQLSPECHDAVVAITKGSPAAEVNDVPASAPAVAPRGPMPMMRPREAFAVLRICSEDEHRLCGGTQPGGGHIIACLADNVSNLSPGCRAALTAARR
jgi:hypothetical protein